MLQSFKRRGLKALVQFLMPELLAGVIVAIAIRSNLSGLRSGFMFQVVFSTSLFILFAESRRVFVVESDTENFYYSPPTLQYHIAIFISFVVISILVAAAIAAAPVFLLFNSPHDFNILISAVVVGWLNSLNLFFILLILVRYIGRNHIKSSLIMLQIFSGIGRCRMVKLLKPLLYLVDIGPLYWKKSYQVLFNNVADIFWYCTACRYGISREKRIFFHEYPVYPSYDYNLPLLIRLFRPQFNRR